MPVKYSRDLILKMIEDASQDMATFHDAAVLSYRGLTSDTKERYGEIAAEWCLNHLDKFDEIVPADVTEVVASDAGSDNGVQYQVEMIIAKAIKNQGALDLVGDIIDFKRPLSGNKVPEAGDVYLAAYDGEILRILELKTPDNKERTLSCVLEGVTHLKSLDTAALLADLNLSADTPVEAHPLVFLNGYQYKEMQQERPYLEQVMSHFNSKPYYITLQDDETFKVIQL